MRLEARQINDGRGPYRWRPVIETPAGLALGTIYDRPHDLAPDRATTAKITLTDKRHEWREADA